MEHGEMPVKDGSRRSLVGVIDDDTKTIRIVVYEAKRSEELATYQLDKTEVQQQEGWSEQDPLEIMHLIQLCAEKAVEQLAFKGYSKDDIVTLGITNQRETTIAWDRFTGEPLHPAIAWNDIRPAVTVDAILAKVPDQNRNYLKSVSGLPISPYFGALKMRWLKDNAKTVRRAGRDKRLMFGTVDSWIVWILGNQQSALVSQNCLLAGQAKNTYRSGCFLLYNTGHRRVQSAHGLLTTVAYRLGPEAEPVYALEGSIAVAGGAMKFLRDNLKLIDDVAKDTEQIAGQLSSTGDVYFVLAFSGLYAPYWRKDARGDILEAMNKDCGMPKLHVNGLMTGNDLLMQLQAILIGIPMFVVGGEHTHYVSGWIVGATLSTQHNDARAQSFDMSALGAAVADGRACGVWRVEAAAGGRRATATPTDTFLPTTTDEDRDACYTQWKMAVQRSVGWATVKKSITMTDQSFRKLSKTQFNSVDNLSTGSRNNSFFDADTDLIDEECSTVEELHKYQARKSSIHQLTTGKECCIIDDTDYFTAKKEFFDADTDLIDEECSTVEELLKYQARKSSIHQLTTGKERCIIDDTDYFTAKKEFFAADTDLIDEECSTVEELLKYQARKLSIYPQKTGKEWTIIDDYFTTKKECDYGLCQCCTEKKLQINTNWQSIEKMIENDPNIIFDGDHNPIVVYPRRMTAVPVELGPLDSVPALLGTRCTWRRSRRGLGRFVTNPLTLPRNSSEKIKKFDWVGPRQLKRKNSFIDAYTDLIDEECSTAEEPLKYQPRKLSIYPQRTGKEWTIIDDYFTTKKECDYGLCQCCTEKKLQINTNWQSIEKMIENDPNIIFDGDHNPIVVYPRRMSAAPVELGPLDSVPALLGTRCTWRRSRRGLGRFVTNPLTLPRNSSEKIKKFDWVGPRQLRRKNSFFDAVTNLIDEECSTVEELLTYQARNLSIYQQKTGKERSIVDDADYFMAKKECDYGLCQCCTEKKLQINTNWQSIDEKIENDSEIIFHVGHNPIVVEPPLMSAARVEPGPLDSVPALLGNRCTWISSQRGLGRFVINPLTLPRNSSEKNKKFDWVGPRQLRRNACETIVLFPEADI